ncbi:hypothetical protein [Billgrantia lactosivorans]|uniref:hypothetical protein n=1 Tax=Billgrantia lactosivorans TaxID=2185141 RepID=UPI0013A6D616|nr:hypothetical protein [Halomonas lactosivorans]
MGTFEKMGARDELRKAMRQLGWSTPRLAEVVYVARNDDDDLEGIARLAERIKKEFQRESTSADKFYGYLKILQAHPEYSKLGEVVPVYHSGTALSPQVERGMKKISEQLSKDLLDEEKGRSFEE